MRALSLALVAWLAVGASTVRADNTADEADLAFSLGNEQFARREYEPALAHYFVSYRLVPNRNVLFNIARCYEALDRFDEAFRYYADLSADPGVAEADRREVAGALARLRPSVALVTVITEPSGAEVFIDREDLGGRGRSPLTLALPVGSHTVLAKLLGYRTGSARVTATKGKEAKQRLSLERISGRVSFTGSPEGAAVRESPDGPVLGHLPGTVTAAPGQRLFVVQADGYLPQQVLVEVKPDATVTASVNLVEKPNRSGKLIVTSNRDKAVVRVDGSDVGFTPAVVFLAPGRHALEVTTDEVTPFVRDIDVVDDTELRVAAELRFSPPPVQAASKTAVSVDQAPASVTVISREEIQTFGYQTLPEALRGIHGFFFTDDRIYTYIGIRGFSPAGDLNARILFLYDGHPVNDVWAGQGYAARDFDVDLSEVERIEVVRGPASLLFGTGAFFGVINVVPRARVQSGRNVQGVVGTGGVGGVKARATGSLGSEGRSLIVSGAGFFASGAEVTDLGSVGTVRGLDGEQVLGASLRGQLGGFTLVGKLNQRVKQIPTAPLGSDVGVAGTQYTDLRGFGELRYEHSWSRVSLLGRVGYDASRYEGVYARSSLLGTAFSVDGGGGDWLSAEVRAFFSLSEGHRLMASLETSTQFITQRLVGVRQPGEYTRVLLSGTLLDEWRITSWLFVQGGLRFDRYFDLEDVALSPRLALVLKPYNQGVTKLVAGQAFRAPTYYELYFNDSLQTQRAALGMLRPEVITTFEVEHAHDVSQELRVSAGGYYNLIDRLVALKQENLEVPGCGGADPVQCYAYRNTTTQLTALGGQVALRWQPGRFTLVDAQYSAVLLGGPGLADAPSYPTHLASLRAMVPIREGLRLSGQATYQSPRRDGAGNPVGEALVLDFGLSGDVARLRYFAGVRNLLDQRTVLPVTSDIGVGQVPQYGRTFWVELAASF